MFHTSYFGKLKDSRSVDVEEIVSLFLHIIAYHVKNWVIKFRFLRCGENDSGHFNATLNVEIHHQWVLLKKNGTSLWELDKWEMKVT